MCKSRLIILIGLLITGGLLCLTTEHRLEQIPVLLRLNQLCYDWQQNLHHETTPISQIVIVDIDDESLRIGHGDVTN